MALIIVPLLIALIGLLILMLASKPKAVQIGYALFCIGAFFATQAAGTHVVKLF